MSEYESFLNVLKSKYEAKYDVVFLCIGTDRIIGDCIGPITGSLLKNKIGDKFVYGNLDENLTFNNVLRKVHEVKVKFSNPYIIAIDAALSDEENIGKIFVDESGISIGHGLCKRKRNIGNVGIKAVVGKDYNDRNLNFRALQNISLGQIISFSKKISDGILDTLNK